MTNFPGCRVSIRLHACKQLTKNRVINALCYPSYIYKLMFLNDIYFLFKKNAWVKVESGELACVEESVSLHRSARS